MIEASASSRPEVPETTRESLAASSMSQPILIPLPFEGQLLRFAEPLWFVVIVLCGICLGSVGGCNRSDRPPLANVHGHVTLDGKPVAGASAVFAPAAGGRRSSGVTNDQGEYVFTYIREDKGGAVGVNSVRIGKQKTHDPRSETLPPKYNRDTMLTAEVKPGVNEIDFLLTSK
jgi:hypothetical protein